MKMWQVRQRRTVTITLASMQMKEDRLGPEDSRVSITWWKEGLGTETKESSAESGRKTSDCEDTDDFSSSESLSDISTSLLGELSMHVSSWEFEISMGTTFAPLGCLSSGVSSSSSGGFEEGFAGRWTAREPGKKEVGKRLLSTSDTGCSEEGTTEREVRGRR